MACDPALTPLPPSLLTWGVEGNAAGEALPPLRPLGPSPRSLRPPVRATPPAAPPTPRGPAAAPDAVFT